MKGMVRGEALSRSLMLLGLSAAFLVLWVQREAIASIPRNKEVEVTTRQLKPQSHVVPGTQLPRLPAVQQRSPVDPIEETKLVIKLKERRVYVYHNNKVKTSYPIAIGKQGWETPTGKFKVLQMIANPAWEHPWNGKVFPPGPNNPLGLRWIGFWTDGKNTIGFHGTPNERVMGQAVSHGCVRMRNRDVIALFELVKVGTPVIVEP